LPRLTIDGVPVEVAPGATVFDAAEAAGVRLPALCRERGKEALGSCMACLVKDVRAGRLVPACSCPARDGMEVETGGEARDARRDSVEFLLSEHAGDCEAPCRRACPAGLDAPALVRRLREGDLPGALEVVRARVALPASVALACPAPCEKSCRRARLDGAVPVRLLHRLAGEAGLAPGAALPPAAPPSGKRVAVAGAGPAGLAAARFLLLSGHACTVFEERAEPGGGLRAGVPADVLPRRVLDAEIGAIRALGAEFRTGARLGRDVRLEDLRTTSHAVVLAVGEAGTAGVPGGEGGRGVAADPATGMTLVSGVFAAGAAVRPGRIAARSSGDARDLAESVDRFLRGGPAALPARRFDMRLGPLGEGEMEEFLKEADPALRAEPSDGEARGLSPDEARREARRCLRCDCRKKDACLLRRAAEETGAEGRRPGGAERRRFERDLGHPGLVHEPGKCVLCGICVRTAREAGEPLGLAFLGRGFRTRVGVPFGEPLSRGLERCAEEIARACPTGAFARR
jgi:ferredoxin